jgi:hypothetical protein
MHLSTFLELQVQESGCHWSMHGWVHQFGCHTR